MIIVDSRLEEIKKIVESVVSKTLLPSTQCLVTCFNELFLVVDDTVMYTIPLKEQIAYAQTYAFNYGKFLSLVSDDIDFSVVQLDIADNILFDKLTFLSNYYISSTKNEESLVGYDTDLKSAESFKDYLNIKAADGMKYYKLPNINDPALFYLIPIFSGFPNISTQDKLGIYVYDTRDGFLSCRFQIFKKKLNREINMIFKIINLTER